jgi:hypothetical protein
MKKILTIAAVLAVAVPVASFAASLVLTNGGLGQVASNPSQFGVAVCDGGSAAVSQSVPVTVTANGQTATLSSANSIAIGACQYSYVSYSQFNLQAGQTYPVAVSINGGAQANYSMTVPGGTTAAATQPAPTANTADVNAQSGNIFTAFWHWFVNLF